MVLLGQQGRGNTQAPALQWEHKSHPVQAFFSLFNPSILLIDVKWLCLPRSWKHALTQTWHSDITCPELWSAPHSELLCASKEQAGVLSAAIGLGFYSCAHRENYKSTGQSQPILGETAGFSTGTHALSFTSLKAYQPEGSNPIHYFILACNVIHHFSPLDVNTSLSGKTVAVSAM